MGLIVEGRGVFMRILRNKSASIFLIVMSITCLFFPRNAFSEDERSGFYAGPLSVSAKTVVEKKTRKPVTAENIQQAKRETQEEEQEITEPSSKNEGFKWFWEK